MKPSPFVLSLFLAWTTLFAVLPPSANAQNLTEAERKANNEAITRLVDAGSKSYGQADYAAAGKAFEDALQIARDIRDDNRVAKLLSNLGAVYQKQGDVEKAVAYHLQSIALCEQQGRPEDAAFALMGLANDYSFLGRYDEQIAANERAMPLLEKKKDYVNQAMILTNVSLTYYDLGQTDKALACLTQALAIHNTRQTPPTNKAFTLKKYSDLHRKNNDYDQALEMATQALTLYEAARNAFQAADTQAFIGTIYAQLGRFDLARDSIEKALPTLVRNPQSPAYQGALNNLGSVFLEMENYPDAITTLEKALDTNKRYPYGISRDTLLVNLGLAYGTTGKSETALQLLNTALEMAEKAKDTFKIAGCYQSLGTVYFKASKLPAAGDYFEKAIGLRRKQGQSLDLIASLASLAGVRTEQGQLREVARLYEEAFALQDRILEQSLEGSELGKARRLEGVFLLQYANVLVRLNRPEQALLRLEQGRIRGLARQAAQNRVRLTQLLTPDEAHELTAQTAEYTQARELLRGANSRVMPAGDTGRRAALAQIAAARSRTEKAAQRLRLTRESLLTRHPEYGRLQGANPPSYDDLIALSRRFPRTCFFVFTLAGKGFSLRLTLLNGKLQATRLIAKEETVQEQIVSWRESLLNRRPDEPKNARRLYRSLFENFTFPTAKQTAPDSLVFVTDGALLDVPFAALRDEKGKRLVERFAVSSAFSLGSLTWKTPRTPQKPLSTLLCVADPTVPEANPVIVATRGGFAPLPAARQEGEAVSRLYRGKILTGAEPTKSTVLDAMPNYDLLHFATHGVAYNRDGMRSFLLLAPDKDKDSFLEAREIAGMQLTAKLAVLSACETGQGEKQNGEGLVGLAWAFRAAGVPAIVASQWKVDDAATKDLMVAFYKSLKAGKKKDAALREAMLTVKKTQPQPYFWAAFQLLGTTDPIR